MTKPLVTILLCTHNPRPHFIQRVLQSIRQQTLRPPLWELLIIDNRCDQSLSDWLDIDGMPNTKILKEERLGLHYARTRGLRSAKAKLLVLVDDDNILHKDFLKETLRISSEYPFLGTWGAEVVHEYEIPLDENLAPYVAMLGKKQVSCDLWTNKPFDYEALPIGAGMTLRLNVAKRYLERESARDFPMKLGRSGKALSSCEDYDMDLEAIEMGYGVGIFKSLRVTHLIPSNRLEKGYLLSLAEAIAMSTVILEFLHGRTMDKNEQANKTKLLRTLRLLALPRFQRQMTWATIRGRKRAAQLICDYSSQKSVLLPPPSKKYGT